VGRAHGLDGSFYVYEPGDVDLVVGLAVRVGERDAEILARKGTDERPIVRVALAADRDAADALRGEDIRVPRDMVAPLEDDEYWAEDLEGCVVLAAGREIGVVRKMTVLPSCEMLEVDRVGGGELLVPMVRDAIRAIDVQARRIDVDLAFLDGEQAS
jgi:16S rRNA processing protein RimM